jgi:ketosteroid isomerase-like protein
MAEANPSIFGRVNAGLYFHAFFERFEIEQFEKSPLKSINMGEAILEAGAFKLNMRNNNGDLRELTGNYANLWKKSAAGEWQMEADVWNYDQWVDFKDELTFPSVPSVRTALLARVPPKDSRTIELAAYQKLNSTAVIQGDPLIISYLFAEDALLFPNYSKALDGREAIYSWWQHHVSELPIFDFIHNRMDKLEYDGEFVIQFASHAAAWRNDNGSGYLEQNLLKQLTKKYKVKTNKRTLKKLIKFYKKHE